MFTVNISTALSFHFSSALEYQKNLKAVNEVVQITYLPASTQCLVSRNRRVHSTCLLWHHSNLRSPH